MKPIIIGIGELLWDILPAGARMGGAPANFACHTKSLGAKAAVISRVGADDAGQRIVNELDGMGIMTEGVTTDSQNPTGSVMVTLGNDGQPQFEICSNVAWDHLCVTPQHRQLVSNANAICFGSLGQRSAISRKAIRTLVSEAPESSLKVFDVNLRGDFFTENILHESLNLANVCKLSDAELPVIAELLKLTGDDASDQLNELQSRYQLRLVVYTRGSGGSVLGNGHRWCESPALSTDVRDTIGAGDSFTAATVMGALQGWSLETISQNANEVAAHVCAHHGAIPNLPASICDRFSWTNWDGCLDSPEGVECPTSFGV
ncbi:MAG: carbohydrate kinase [Akkermansiaceae bacterium]|nr:carbohydrate kinase [Akkermansiaceae bacterium]